MQTVEDLCRIIEMQNDIIRKQGAALGQLEAVCCEEERAALEKVLEDK